MLHSNPGDYAWGQGGLDAVITQVCETWHYFTSGLYGKVKKKLTCVCVFCSYLVSWKTRALLQQRKRRSLLSQLLMSLRNKQVSKKVLLQLSLWRLSPIHWVMLFIFSPGLVLGFKDNSVCHWKGLFILKQMGETTYI